MGSREKLGPRRTFFWGPLCFSTRNDVFCEHVQRLVCQYRTPRSVSSRLPSKSIKVPIHQMQCAPLVPRSTEGRLREKKKELRFRPCLPGHPTSKPAKPSPDAFWVSLSSEQDARTRHLRAIDTRVASVGAETSVEILETRRWRLRTPRVDGEKNVPKKYAGKSAAISCECGGKLCNTSWMGLRMLLSPNGRLAKLATDVCLYSLSVCLLS